MTKTKQIKRRFATTAYIDSTGNSVQLKVLDVEGRDEVALMFCRPASEDPDIMEIMPKGVARRMARHIMKVTKRHKNDSRADKKGKAG